MALLVDCAGAPRDVGVDQGRACRAVLADGFGGLPRATALALRLGLTDASVRDLRRDLARHFPHLSEVLAGLAVGSGVPEAYLAREIAGELATGRAPASALAGQDAVLARQLPGSVLVRRSRPEGLFASVELTRPWLPSALLGVNERGLAVAVAETAAEEGTPPSTPPGERCAAPAALLAQDCLERFEAIEAALDWCAARPAGGCATILLGDSRGEVAGIAIAGSERRVLRPADGALARDAAGADLAKALREARAGSALPGDVARVEPRQRMLSAAGATFRV